MACLSGRGERRPHHGQSRAIVAQLLMAGRSSRGSLRGILDGNSLNSLTGGSRNPVHPYTVVNHGTGVVHRIVVNYRRVLVNNCSLVSRDAVAVKPPVVKMAERDKGIKARMQSEINADADV